MESGKKRVRFSESGNSVRHFEPEPAAEDEPDSKRPAVQRGGGALDPMEALEGEISGVCLGGGGGGMAAGQAAAMRAASRRTHALGGAFGGGGGGEDEYGEDFGEEDYEDPEIMFDPVSGVPIEPFHLKREREEGYFDEGGNYVEFQRPDVEDAWADALCNTEIDEAWLARVMQARGGQAEGVPAADVPEMPPAEVRAHKQRLLDLLLPGETALQALRRLGAVRRPVSGSASGGGEGGGAAGSGRVSPTESDPLARHPRALRSLGMPVAIRERFEELTALSSRLMEQGEYGVHSMTREQLERSLEAEPSGSGNGGGAASAPVLPTAGGGGAAHQLAERLLAAAARPGSAAGSSGSAGGTNGKGAGAAAVQQQAAADPEADLFADEEPPAAAGAAAAAQPPPSVQGAQQQEGPSDVAMGDGQQQEPAAQQQQQQAAGAPAPAGLAAAAGGLDGFIADPSTGLLYNSELGAYYDAQRGLFGDSASGNWFSFDAATGQYVLAG